jgi:V/A-type H+-transporting ATPase subunit K
MEAIFLAYVGLVLMVGVCGIGSIYGLTICGKAVAGAMKKSPDKMGTYIALSAIPSSQGLYGFVGYMIMQPYAVEGVSWLVTSGILCAGLLMGISGLISAIRQAEICAEGIAGTASGHNVFASSMVMAVFPELYVILTLVVTIVIRGTFPLVA